MKLANNQTVILGPPGCGKTTRLLNILDGHLGEEVKPWRIAYFSFTRKAVNEARDRARSKFELSVDDLTYFRTIHSMVFSLNGHRKADVLSAQHYDEIGRTIGVDFASTFVDESSGMPTGGAKGDQHLFIHALSRARRVPLQRQWEECSLPDIDFRAVERTVAAVEAYKKANALVDFTDMLENYLQHGAPIDVDVAFVDEAQDLSALQWQVLRRMLSNCPVVYVAGDDDQAIYRWSGADVRSFLSLGGEREMLKQSWRCPQKVHRVADSIASRIAHRFNKTWAPKPQLGRVARIAALESFDLTELQGSTLLLARNSYLLGDYAEQLRKRGLTYFNSYGASSVSKPHARAITAWQKLCRGEAQSDAEVKVIYDQLRVGVGVKRGFKGLGNMPDRSMHTLEGLRQQYGLLAEGNWFDALDGIPARDVTYYRSILRAGRSLLGEPTISINTVHGVKGGEADNVIVNPDMAWKSFRDYEKSPDDEHRVAYVAVSRAKQNLFLLSPKTKNFYRYVEGL